MLRVLTHSILWQPQKVVAGKENVNLNSSRVLEGGYHGESSGQGHHTERFDQRQEEVRGLHLGLGRGAPSDLRVPWSPEHSGPRASEVRL